MNKILCFILTLWHLCSSGEVISIEQNKSGFFINSIPSSTLYWKGVNSEALILFLPGGDGNLGLKPDTVDRKYSFYQTLKSLTNPELTTGKFDVVLLDFPFPIKDINARGSEEHIVRIESAINFYRAKTGLPIWLMGHSNGGISLTYFIQYALKNHKIDSIAGVIASGVRNGTTFKSPVDFPLLFLHHEKDSCTNTVGEKAYDLYTNLKAASSLDVEFYWVTSGESEQYSDPCRSGYHMYFNSGTEASKVIEKFILKHLK